MELSRDAIIYLRRLFEAFKTNAGKLDEFGLEKIFATTERGVPWRVKLETVYVNGITYDIWLALWQKFFSHNPKEAFKNFLFCVYRLLWQDERRHHNLQVQD